MYKTIKRLIDIIVSFFLLVFTLPITVIVTLLLFIANSGKPFFFQKRPGKNENVFTIIKFKTMNDKKDRNGNLLDDEKRLTWIGKIVRKTSIDELPQLINVLIGDMSLIGPRPLLTQYLPYYNNVEKRRHEVRPGITGWAQVNGRNAISWDQKFAYDVWYVDHYNFNVDMKIVMMTIKKVFKSEGISAEGHATMPTFIEHVNSKTNGVVQ
jgi:lipopolysaccharide/colanic/teichoic acid biosynthesis glycosyltransferase